MTEPRSDFPKITTPLLKWYDANARALPWRVGPAARKKGVRPDPYAIWLSEIMLQQTTVATVTPRYGEFLKRWPNVQAMAAAPVEDVLGQWAGLGYYARARNLHKCAGEVVQRFNGNFPQTEEELLSLPGVGGYTAAAVAAIAFDRRAIVVDGNIERVGARLFLIETAPPKLKLDIKNAFDEIWPTKRAGDYAQALMDLGASICTPKNPRCTECPLRKKCKSFAGSRQYDLPARKKKTAKQTRYGVVYILENTEGEVLFERRPSKGLLGGMLGLPGPEWTQGFDSIEGARDHGTWRSLGEARHTFTHFHLILDVRKKTTRRRAKKDEIWLHPDEARLPTVMQKALDLNL